MLLSPDLNILVTQVELMTSDEEWMQQALELAAEAEAKGEVPVGAVVVLDQQVIGRGFNQPISSCDPTAHAEIVALRNAARSVDNYRLVDATLYVTLEPCTMCTGAIIHSRICRLVFGASEPKAGVIESRLQMLDADYLNHKVEYRGGVCRQQCGEVISRFFASRREQVRKAKR